MNPYRKIWLFAGIASLVLAGCSAKAEDGIVADIRADSNRDGVVDGNDVGSGIEKGSWTAQYGAIVLPNIGDVARRCPSSRSQVSDAELAACHDAADDVARAPEYLAPLLTRPAGRVGDGATGRVQPVGLGADKIRIFVKRQDAWVRLRPAATLTETELRHGATLGIDSRDVVRDKAIWDGSVTVRFTVHDGNRTVSDDIALRVAPVLLHSHNQSAEALVVPESGGDPEYERFVGDLTSAAQASGLNAPLITVNTTDTWAQDFVEFGYVSMPGPGGRNVSLRIAIRSPQPEREGGRAVFDLKGPGMGAIQLGGAGDRHVDSFGNVETIPPYTHNGKEFPAGRVVIGTGNRNDAAVSSVELQKFFAAQRVQPPLILDTTWLVVGHVDEFIQFLPASSGRGWRPAVTDPRRGLEILREQQRSGHGGERAFSRPDAPDRTIDAVLADQKFIADNELAARKIDENVERMFQETGTKPEEFVRIPGLYELSAGIDDEPDALVSFYPGAINGVLINATNYIAPRQWGPMVGGRDVFEAAVTEAYRSAGVAVRYVDEWETLHVAGGEIHCGTNVLRQTGNLPIAETE
ncbi:protein-arginine deiminase domain-containing protein [Nocardia sp. NPDC051321]|uniref:protein-arginine deiminase domain-containing protein n=1 Tax=Nocardia sp. NPDC051321 TaxID=3364323 RepID=UPI00378920D3